MKLHNPIPKYPTAREFTAEISQFFGENPQIYAQFGIVGHNGLDITGHQGTPIASMSDGHVYEATAKDTGYGLRITTFTEYEPGKGFEITYGHFQSVVYPGYKWKGYEAVPYAEVKAGEIIGLMDSTGFSTGHHLHITLRLWEKTDGTWTLLNKGNGYFGAVDPLPYLQFTGMASLIKDNRTQPARIGVVEWVDEPKNLIWKAKQVGLPIKVDLAGNIIWDKLSYDGEIN